MTMTCGVPIPDSKLAREVTEIVRDTKIQLSTILLEFTFGAP